jgi:antibiotic biosynthesis monooxygenase (ABM) superfamily enzyme
MSASRNPVTVMVTRRVHAGREAEFEKLMAGMRADAEHFEGHLGGYLIKPDEGRHGLYQMLFAFDNDAHMRAWTGSPKRRRWLDRIAELSDGEGALSVLTGLEGWFALPGARTRPPPAKHKMAFVTWLGIFPLVLVLSSLIGPWLAPIHPVLSVMVVTGLVTVAMTWLVMPLLARLFARWLYPLS